MGPQFGRMLAVVCPALCGAGGLALGLLAVVLAGAIAARRKRS
jgi:hypothetical protein